MKSAIKALPVFLCLSCLFPAAGGIAMAEDIFLCGRTYQNRPCEANQSSREIKRNISKVPAAPAVRQQPPGGPETEEPRARLGDFGTEDAVQAQPSVNEVDAAVTELKATQQSLPQDEVDRRLLRLRTQSNILCTTVEAGRPGNVRDTCARITGNLEAIRTASRRR